mmetsp:Transcript_11254/g.18386  ORF Transcript_11254/g.18386 Transcript_11254/m.18386 type:complete len:215 (+) Transcript_11254:2048-2692(+)
MAFFRSNPFGTFTRQVSASGTRTNSACPPCSPCPFSTQPNSCPERHLQVSPSLHIVQFPQLVVNGHITWSPISCARTSAPFSTTCPTNSCPIIVPASSPVSLPLYGCKSDPQIAAYLTLTTQSPLSRTLGLSTTCTANSNGRTKHTAFIFPSPSPIPCPPSQLPTSTNHHPIALCQNPRNAIAKCNPSQDQLCDNFYSRRSDADDGSPGGRYIL